MSVTLQKWPEDNDNLLKDAELRRTMGKRGRELAVERYSTEKIIPQYISFYESVLNSSQRSAVSGQ